MDITTLNSDFKAFMDFAKAKVDAGAKETVVRSVPGGGALAGRTIAASTTDSVKGLFHWSRSDDDKAANNATRAIFKQSIIDIFGGESKIPSSVKEAMILDDYDQGKPLTARRITAVAKAIRELGIENAFEAPGTQPGEMKRLAEAAGYAEKDFGRLNRAANLYAKSFNVPLRDALRLAIDKKSEVNAAMEAGEIYMKDADSFRKGVLKLSESLALASANNAIATQMISTNSVKGYAQIAKNIAREMRSILDDVDAELAKEAAPNNAVEALAKARQTLNKTAKEFENIANRINNGELTDERAVVDSVLHNNKYTQAIQALTQASTKMLKNNPELRNIASSLKAAIDRITNQNDALNDAFKKALIEREGPKSLEKIAKTGAKVPQHVLDGMNNFLNQGFKAVEMIDNFCEKLTKNGDASLHFTAEQKTQLLTMLKSVMGEAQADKVIGKIVDELEVALFTECLTKDNDQIVDGKPRTTQIIEHFQKYPEALKALNLSFNMEKLDDIKAELKNKMTEDIAKSLSGEAKEMTTFKAGLYPQAIREYNTGYVTFNGGEIHSAQTNKKFYGAMNNSQNGYAEFLHELFPEGQVKMRETVSYICGMANGLGGSIDTMFTDGPKSDPTLINGIARMTGPQYNLFFGTHNRAPGENYDITQDEQGNITIKMTHIAHTTLTMIMPEGKAPVTFSTMDTQAPIVAQTKFVVTVKIPFATDAELGDAMPQFEIADLSQEPM